MRCFDPIFRTRAGLVALALVGLGGLSACSLVSLLPVRPVQRPPSALTLPAEPPAPEPLQPAPKAPAINLPAPPAPLPPASAAMVESPGVAARFPDPALSYATPAFAPGHTDFTSNAELRNLLHGLLREGGPNGTTVRLQALGSSQRGEPLEALLFTRRPDAPSPGVPGRPTVLLIGQQHGDEPAGSEALLVVAQELAHGSLGSLLDRIDVVVLARANPDGAAARQRTTASGIDANRDHLLLRTPEAQAQARLLRDFAPVVVVDAHEYPVAGLFTPSSARSSASTRRCSTRRWRTCRPSSPGRPRTGSASPCSRR